MYRVGGIAVYNVHLLVEHNVRHDFCFVPGGRVECGALSQARTRAARPLRGRRPSLTRPLISAGTRSASRRAVP